MPDVLTLHCAYPSEAFDDQWYVLASRGESLRTVTALARRKPVVGAKGVLASLLLALI